MSDQTIQPELHTLMPRQIKQQYSGLITDTFVSERFRAHETGYKSQSLQNDSPFFLLVLNTRAHTRANARNPTLHVSFPLCLSHRAACLFPLSTKISALLCVQDLIRYLCPIFAAKETLTSSQEVFKRDNYILKSRAVTEMFIIMLLEDSFNPQ